MLPDACLGVSRDCPAVAPSMIIVLTTHLMMAAPSLIPATLASATFPVAPHRNLCGNRAMHGVKSIWTPGGHPMELPPGGSVSSVSSTILIVDMFFLIYRE